MFGDLIGHKDIFYVIPSKIDFLIFSNLRV
jgi:hypothetical protein